MKVVLLILFNHKFERNLPRLREIYGSRFDHIYFIMPFYTGNDKDVISVYENSFYFQGYIAQALNKIEDEYDHYMVIGDDLVLNPSINQDNYTTYFKLEPDGAFIPEIFLLHNESTPKRLMRKEDHWFWNPNATKFRIDQLGIEVAKELPSYDEAERALKQHGYEFEPVLSREMVLARYPKWGAENVNDIKTYAKHVINCAINNYKLRSVKRRTIRYPVVGSYSDIVIIPKKHINKFALYCGVTAALKLFVEIAIPTCLLLTVENITQEKDLDNKGLTLWEPAELKEMEDKYSNHLNALFNAFPESTLYIHPVKLSKWK